MNIVIDTHVYCLPEKLRDIKVKLPSTEKPVIQSIYRHPEGEYALNLCSPEEITRSMERSGIDKSVLVSFPWRSLELCRQNNDYVLAQAAKDNRFMAVCSVNPGHKNWKREVKKCLDSKATGIKVNPGWQAHVLDGQEIVELSEFLSEKSAFLMVHVDHCFKDSVSSANRLFNLAKACPRTKILACHLGGMLGLYNLYQPVRSILKNVWFDTAVSSTVRMVDFYLQAGLADKIVFGSDFPFNHNHQQDQVIKAIRALKMGRSNEDKVFSKNFLRLAKGK